MKIVNDEPVVVIDIPRFYVPLKDAKKYIREANEYFSDTQNELIADFGCVKAEYDNYYCYGQFIPTIKERDYSGILDSKVEIKQLDKYVLVDKDETIESDVISNLWNGKNEQE